MKAHRYLTHRKRLLDLEDSLQHFLRGARRLRPALGPLLYQLPPQFGKSPENTQRLEQFLAALPGDLMHAVEFRNPSWWKDDEAFCLLRRYRVAFVWHDMGGVDVPLQVTAPFAYLRFHGAGQAYRGAYPDQRLFEMASRIARLGVDSAWAYFNNDAEGHAFRNAITLRDILSAPSLPGGAAAGL